MFLRGVDGAGAAAGAALGGLVIAAQARTTKPSRGKATVAAGIVVGMLADVLSVREIPVRTRGSWKMRALGTGPIAAVCGRVVGAGRWPAPIKDVLR
jgi:hypothetical protein